MRLDMSKTGQGAFSVTVDDDGTTIANGRTFKTPQEAYDFFLPSGRGGFSAWNICYALEDVGCCIRAE
jgi:hypothetical protein